MNVLLDLIHTRAKASYEGPVVTAGNYGVWARHWFATAEALMVEFSTEGLYNTAYEVASIIAEQKKYCKEYLDTTE